MNIPHAIARTAKWRGQAAIHEAGHVIMWRHFGFDAWAQIWPEDGLWGGEAGSTRQHASDFLGPLQARMVCVAGAVAEAIWCWRWHGDAVHWADCMSDADWRTCPFREKGQRAFDEITPAWKRAATLVQKRFDPALGGDLWPYVCRLASDIRHHHSLAEKPYGAVIEDSLSPEAA